MESHFRKLENMYLSARMNTEIYKGITIHISEGKSELTLPVEPKYHHAANSMHGSIYFKMLDDAAFFAVNSIISDTFVYTVSMNIQLLRPVASGIIKSVGEIKFKSNQLFIADSILYNEDGKEVGRGTGNFMKSKIKLENIEGYN